MPEQWPATVHRADDQHPAYDYDDKPAGRDYNTPYAQSIAVVGGTAPDTFAVTAGSLPPGLSLNSGTGAITGTPTTTSGSPFFIHHYRTDLTDAIASKSYTVAINTGSTITTTSLPNWTVNRPYSQTIAVSGAINPVSFAVAGGNLPTGLSLNGSSGQ